MSKTFKAVAYSYASNEPQPFLFDVFCLEDGRVTLDIHKRFTTEEECKEAMTQAAISLTPSMPIEEVSLEEALAI